MKETNGQAPQDRIFRCVVSRNSTRNAQQDIYLTDDDKQEFVPLLQWACERYHWFCHAYCLMTNHYHLLIETQTPSLSKGMKYLNGTYTQAFNRSHKRVGHVFQGRYKGILVEKDSYLLELSRYIVLNPVRARMVRSAKKLAVEQLSGHRRSRECPSVAKAPRNH